MGVFATEAETIDVIFSNPVSPFTLQGTFDTSDRKSEIPKWGSSVMNLIWQLAMAGAIGHETNPGRSAGSGGREQNGWTLVTRSWGEDVAVGTRSYP